LYQTFFQMFFFLRCFTDTELFCHPVCVRGVCVCVCACVRVCMWKIMIMINHSNIIREERLYYMKLCDKIILIIIVITLLHSDLL